MADFLAGLANRQNFRVRGWVIRDCDKIRAAANDFVPANHQSGKGPASAATNVVYSESDGLPHEVFRFFEASCHLAPPVLVFTIRNEYLSNTGNLPSNAQAWPAVCRAWLSSEST